MSVKNYDEDIKKQDVFSIASMDGLQRVWIIIIVRESVLKGKGLWSCLFHQIFVILPKLQKWI